MKSRKFFLPIMLIIIAMVIVACGGDGDDDGDGDSGDNGGGDTNLSQSATLNDPTGLTLTMSYPDDWSANTENGAFAVGNSDDVLSRIGGNSAPEGDEVGGSFSALSSATFGLPEDTPLMDIYNAAQPAMAGAGSPFTLGDAEEFTTNGKSGVVAFGTGDFDGETGDAALYMVDTGDGIVFGIVAAREGELEQHDDTFRAMLGTAEISTSE